MEMERVSPQVSLIVPVYNAAAYLEAGVTALLGQTFADFEVILVDDGATDQSGALCDALAEADARVRVIHKENGGAGSARNAGIDAARGEYLMFPDADDVCLPTMVETLLSAAKRTGADVTLCGYQSVDEGGERETVSLSAAEYVGAEAVHRFAAGLFPLGVVGYPWNKLYRADFIAEGGLRFPDMRRFQDGVFNLDVFDKAARVCVLPDVLYRYKINDLQGIFQKFPANIFDLLRQITDAFLEKRAAWGFADTEYNENIRPFFLNGVVGCVDCLYSPSWDMDRAARRAYLERLSADATVRRCAVSCEGLGRYAATVVRLLMKQRFGVLLCAVRAKLFLKTHCRGLFYRLKGA